FLGEPEECADPVGGRGDLLDDLVHLLDGGPRLRQRDVVFLDLLAQPEQIHPGGIAVAGGGDQFVHQVDRGFRFAATPVAKVTVTAWSSFSITWMIAHRPPLPLRARLRWLSIARLRNGCNGL